MKVFDRRDRKIESVYFKERSANEKFGATDLYVVLCMRLKNPV